MNYLELISNDEDINNESYKKEELNSLKVLNMSISLTNFEECELKDSIYENVHFDKVNFNIGRPYHVKYRLMWYSCPFYWGRLPKYRLLH